MNGEDGFSTAGRRRRAWRAAVVLAAGVLALCLAARAQPPRPWVQVLVEIESPSLRDSLHTDRPRAEADLGRRLAELLRERHPFVGWRGAAQAGPAPGLAAAPMGTLLARVVDVGSAATGSAVELAWALRGAQGDERLPVPAVALYLPFESGASRHDAALFVAHAHGRLGEKIRVQGFDEVTRLHVLRRLPIARAVEPLASDRVVLLPLRWQDLRLGAGSTLEVLVTQPTPSGERVNRALLSEVRERRQGAAQHRGLVQAAVNALKEDSIDVPLQQQWSPRLPALLRGTSVACYVTHFMAAEATPGGVELDP